MKKFFLNVIILTFCLLGIGCGNIKNKQIVQEAEIKSDMQNKDVFAKHTIPITTINIIKRQTNIKDKEDIIYVTINGKMRMFLLFEIINLNIYCIMRDGHLIQYLNIRMKSILMKLYPCMV